MSSGAEEVIDVYERHADAWDRDRGADLALERAWIERFAALLPAGGAILDIGCGSGQPIARYLVEQGFDVVGVDSSPTLIARCRARFPGQEWIHADMRTLALDRTFQGLIAWDSFFHLPHAQQRAMFPVFQAHAAPGALLLLTTGPAHGEAIGSYQGEPLYHASLSGAEYRELLHAHGFGVIAQATEDASCGGHTVWLAQSGTQE